MVEVAATKLTFTEATVADTPELVPCPVMLESVEENPEAGLVMATFGPVAAKEVNDPAMLSPNDRNEVLVFI